jgi:hypothetical protein
LRESAEFGEETIIPTVRIAESLEVFDGFTRGIGVAFTDASIQKGVQIEGVSSAVEFDHFRIMKLNVT